MDTRQQLLALMRSPYDFDAIYKWAKAFMDRELTATDIRGFAAAVGELATPLEPDTDLSKSIDISGTGGDASRTINVGTITAFVLATAGMTVGKQSTRGYTGVIGSQDFLASLGIAVNRENVEPKAIESLLTEQRLAFYMHPAFNDHFANHVRFFNELKEKNLSFVTPWHLLFWTYNPLPLTYRIYGMNTDRYLKEVAETFRSQGVKRGWVVYGIGNVDEISVVGPTKIAEFDSSGIKEFELNPSDFGVSKSTMQAIRVADAQEAIAKATAVLRGELGGPLQDLVSVNAGAGLYLAGIAGSLSKGTDAAREILISGKAQRKYEAYKAAAAGRT